MSTNNRISVNIHGKLSKPIRINAMQFIAANVWSENLDVSDTTHLIDVLKDGIFPPDNILEYLYTWQENVKGVEVLTEDDIRTMLACFRENIKPFISYGSNGKSNAASVEESAND